MVGSSLAKSDRSSTTRAMSHGSLFIDGNGELSTPKQKPFPPVFWDAKLGSN